MPILQFQPENNNSAWIFNLKKITAVLQIKNDQKSTAKKAAAVESDHKMTPKKN